MSLTIDIELIQKFTGPDLLSKFYGLGWTDHRLKEDNGCALKSKQTTCPTVMVVQSHAVDDTHTYYESIDIDSGEGITEGYSYE